MKADLRFQKVDHAVNRHCLIINDLRMIKQTIREAI